MTTNRRPRPPPSSGVETFTIESFGRYLLHDPVHHVWDVECGNEVLAER